ncbi:MAG: hypothetical protein HS113_17065 [Verrucomicrobiales bacterium]|nr:hypothetical protein [Verrucomicrobiales bacterium]
MKTTGRPPRARHLPTLVLLLVGVSLVAGCAHQGSQTSAATPPAKGASPAVAKAKPVRYVEVTGSRIPVRVEGEVRNSDLPMNLTVVDPEDPMNRGDISPLDSLTRNPWASRGYRGY